MATYQIWVFSVVYILKAALHLSLLDEYNNSPNSQLRTYYNHAIAALPFYMLPEVFQDKSHKRKAIMLQVVTVFLWVVILFIWGYSAYIQRTGDPQNLL